MKRTILTVILCLMLCSAAYGENKIVGAVIQGAVCGSSGAAATSYCTGATTCPATTPGSCENLCEDFEGAEHCVDSASYDSVCRLEHRWGVIIGTGESIDYTTTHSGTFACTDKGSNATKVTVGAGNSTHFYNASLSNANDTYVEFYVNINSLTLADGKRQGIHCGYRESYNELWTLRVLRTGSAYNLEATCYTCAAAGVGSTDLASYLDGSTWIRIGIAAKKSDDTFTVFLNGSAEISKTDYTTTATFIGPSFGSNAISLREGNSVMQFDNIAISTSALPGGCNP